MFMIDYKIPIWQIITFFIITGTPVIWGLISMYFRQGTMKTQMDEMKQIMEGQFVIIDNIKKEIEDKIDSHKVATDRRLMDINNILVETKTLVNLLVQDKIKN